MFARIYKADNAKESLEVNESEPTKFMLAGESFNF